MSEQRERELDWQTGRELERKDAEIASLRNQLGKAVSVLKGYEQWEADIIMEDKCWTEQNIQFTDVIYNRMIELQTQRNAVLSVSDEMRADDTTKTS